LWQHQARQKTVVPRFADRLRCPTHLTQFLGFLGCLGAFNAFVTATSELPRISSFGWWRFALLDRRVASFRRASKQQSQTLTHCRMREHGISQGRVRLACEHCHLNVATENGSWYTRVKS
jgi:hypothetical protein